jgi:peroxiredoxin Q/BCP
MSDIKPGAPAPDFTLPASGKDSVSLSDYHGRKLVLYFYPKDDTPGCTTESCAFRDNLKDFDKLGIDIIGISKDSVASHEKFIKKYDLNFPLASDESGSVCEKFGVWKEKSMYGKKYMGIERSTFLIDENGKIAHIWRNVKVPGHIDEVKTVAAGMAKAA